MDDYSNLRQVDDTRKQQLLMCELCTTIWEMQRGGERSVRNDLAHLDIDPQNTSAEALCVLINNLTNKYAARETMDMSAEYSNAERRIGTDTECPYSAVIKYIHALSRLHNISSEEL